MRARRELSDSRARALPRPSLTPRTVPRGAAREIGRRSYVRSGRMRGPSRHGQLGSAARGRPAEVGSLKFRVVFVARAHLRELVTHPAEFGMGEERHRLFGRYHSSAGSHYRSPRSPALTRQKEMAFHILSRFLASHDAVTLGDMCVGIPALTCV